MPSLPRSALSRAWTRATLSASAKSPPDCRPSTSSELAFRKSRYEVGGTRNPAKEQLQDEQVRHLNCFDPDRSRWVHLCNQSTKDLCSLATSHRGWWTQHRH